MIETLCEYNKKGNITQRVLVEQLKTIRSQIAMAEKKFFLLEIYMYKKIIYGRDFTEYFLFNRIPSCICGRTKVESSVKTLMMRVLGGELNAGLSARITGMSKSMEHDRCT